MAVRTLPLPGPKAQEYIARDTRHISPSYPRDVPFVMDHGCGTEAWDVDGNRFLDLAAGIAVVTTGHAHPAVVKAIQDQAAGFIHISADYYHPKWIELGEKLDEIAPFKEDALCFMTNSGAESVEAAIKLARFVTGRPRFLGFHGGFHGRTMGALAFTASKPVYRHKFYPTMPGVIHAPFPNPYRPVLLPRHADYGETVVEYIESEVFEHVTPAEDCAAILVEPIQGEGGYVIPPPGFFPALRKLCDRYGIILIVDEVQSGIGRTGRWWGVQHFGVEPDMVCSAKGIASGMPLGALIARKSVMTWPRGAHGNTYGGNPISCAAALETLRLVQSEYMANARAMGEHALARLEAMRAAHPSIGDVRGLGLMIGVEFVKDKATKEPARALRNRIVHNAFSHGALMLGCGDSVIRLAPPLSISKEHLDEGLDIFDFSIGEAERAEDG